MKNPMRWILLAVVCIMTACKQDDGNVLTVNGIIENIDQIASSYPNAVHNGKLNVGLYEIPFGSADAQPIILDTVTISVADKNFHLKGVVTTNGGLYSIMVQNGPSLPLINDSKEMTVSLDFSNKSKFYTVKGSEASTQLRDFIFTYSDHRNTVEQYMQALDSLKMINASDTQVLVATNRKNLALDKLNAYLKGFLNKANQSTLASFALGRAAQTLPVTDFESSLSQLTQKFPQDSNIADLKNKYEAYKQRQDAAGSWVGKKVPELVLPDVHGKEVSIASYKGKVVLVDFWASWCGPCRAENPNVVMAYNRFKDKNFTVLGVSLDKDKGKWVEAIKKDNLTWTHVSDLAYWQSKAVTTFGFDGIPFNVLVDTSGTVIAQGLRGSALEEKLAEVLK